MNDDEFEIGIILLCPECGVPAEVVVFADMSHEYQCPSCDDVVELPTSENLGFH